MASEIVFHSFQKSVRPTVVERLRELADQIESGELQPGEKDGLRLPDQLCMKIELEEKRIDLASVEFPGEVNEVSYEIEVELTWPVEYSEDD